MSTSQLSRTILILLLAAPMIVVLGCGENTILGSDSHDASFSAFEDANAAPVTGSWTVVASKKVNPGHGSFTVQGSRYTLTFPKGAVHHATTIEILERSPGVVEVRLEPDGLQLRKRISLTIDYAGTANDPSSPDFHGGTARVGRYNPETGMWTTLRGHDDPDQRTYTAVLTSFSRYAMSDGMRFDRRGRDPRNRPDRGSDRLDPVM